MRWNWRKALFGDLSDPEAGPGELGPGVPKPSYALAGMVAAHVLKNAHQVQGTYSNPTKEELKKPSREWASANETSLTFKDGKMSIFCSQRWYNTSHHSRPPCYKLNPLQIAVDLKGKRYPFDELEQNLIAQAMFKAGTLAEERKAAEKMAAQQEAVSP